MRMPVNSVPVICYSLYNQSSVSTNTVPKRAAYPANDSKKDKKESYPVDPFLKLIMI